MKQIVNNVFEKFNNDVTVNDLINLLTQAGWKQYRDTGKMLHFTRPDKRGGTSGVLFTDTRIFNVFTTNSTLDPEGYNAYKLYRDICFGGDKDKTNEYIYNLYGKNQSYSVVYTTNVTPIPENQFDYIGDPSKLINPHDIRKRKFYVSVNLNILNKNLDPETGEAFANWYAFSYGWQQANLTIEEILEHVKFGHGILFGHLNSNERKGNNFVGTDIVAVDIDGTLPLDELRHNKDYSDVLAVYTTARHTLEKHRYRIIIPLHSYFEDIEEVESIIKYYIDSFGGDPACSDPTRGWYGNTETEYFIRFGLYENTNNTEVIYE